MPGSTLAPCSLQLGTTPAASYREYAPLAELRRDVVCTWTLEIDARSNRHEQRVLPDGCSDIIWVADAQPFVVGPMTSSVLSTAKAGVTLVGVRLRPDAAMRILGVPADQLTDRRARLDELWDRRMVQEASDRLWGARTTSRRLAVAQQLVATRHRARDDETVRRAVALLTAIREGQVDTIARQLGMSPRQLRRRFAAAVGYSPKLFHRIVRFQRLLALAHARPAARFDALALHAGYADQPHMTRDVAEFSGVTPTALLGKVDSALSLADMLQDASATS
jgi:AraC-like DNA-binding protein